MQYKDRLRKVAIDPRCDSAAIENVSFGISVCHTQRF